MTNKAITDRQSYWLKHIKAVDTGSASTVDYANTHSLKVKDLYQWNTKLLKLGFYKLDQSASDFVAVKPIAVVAEQTPVPSKRSQCALVFPGGIRFEFGESVSADIIRTVTSELG